MTIESLGAISAMNGSRSATVPLVEKMQAPAPLGVYRGPIEREVAQR